MRLFQRKPEPVETEVSPASPAMRAIREQVARLLDATVTSEELREARMQLWDQEVALEERNRLQRAANAHILEVSMVVTRLIIPCGICAKPLIREQWCPRTAYCSSTHANQAYRHRKAARKRGRSTTKVAS